MTMLEGKGFVCDVCGEKIEEIPIQPITVKGIPQVFHIHKITPEKKCREKLIEAHQKKDWNLLPDGPLKSFYFNMIKIQKIMDEASKEEGDLSAMKEAIKIVKLA